MNIYDRSSEAFKNYIPLPDAEKARKKGMVAIAIYLIGIFLALGCIIARPHFFQSYGSKVFSTVLVVVFSIFFVPFLKFRDQFLKDTQLYHDYLFVSYKTATPQLASRILLTIAALNIIMGNAESAKFAYELVDTSLLKPKSMPTYEKVKEYVENPDRHASEPYSIKSIMPMVYRKLKPSKLLAIIWVICVIILISLFAVMSIAYLSSPTGSY